MTPHQTKQSGAPATLRIVGKHHLHCAASATQNRVLSSYRSRPRRTSWSPHGWILTQPHHHALIKAHPQVRTTKHGNAIYNPKSYNWTRFHDFTLQQKLWFKYLAAYLYLWEPPSCQMERSLSTSLRPSQWPHRRHLGGTELTPFLAHGRHFLHHYHFWSYLWTLLCSSKVERPCFVTIFGTLMC